MGRVNMSTSPPSADTRCRPVVGSSVVKIIVSSGAQVAPFKPPRPVLRTVPCSVEWDVRGDAQSSEPVNKHQIAAGAVHERKDERALVGRERHAEPVRFVQMYERRALAGREIKEIH